MHYASDDTWSMNNKKALNVAAAEVIRKFSDPFKFSSSYILDSN